MQAGTGQLENWPASWKLEAGDKLQAASWEHRPGLAAAHELEIPGQLETHELETHELESGHKLEIFLKKISHSSIT